MVDNCSLEMGPSSFVTVIGRIGSGKTSLLHAIMDENIKSGGSASVRGKVAYVEQEPFIFSGTIKENITFGTAFDEIRFDKAVNAAQLGADMP